MKRKVPIPSLLSVEELADYLGLKKQTIYNWLNQGKISGIKIGKVWRFDKSDIERWLRECKRQK
ncbi:helix-turn-helix domain-containing protein [Candidatus Omnitrophota bacterium]